MLSRRTLVLSSFAVLAAPQTAIARSAYSSAAFESAKASGKPIVVEFHANWCPTCRAQAPIVESFANKNGFIVLRVDYDNQKAVRRAFGVRQQSTLIVFKGRNEVGRAVGITSAASIATLMQKAL
jgi:thioredoxin 1